MIAPVSCACVVSGSAIHATADIIVIFLICGGTRQSLCRSCLRGGNVAADRGSDRAQLSYELRELVGVQGLSAVGKSPVGLRMHLDEDTVRARRDGSTRHRNNFI